MPRSRLHATLSIGLLALLFWAAPAADGARRSQLSEAAGWLADYLRIDTSNPPGNEHQAAAFLSDILHREGIATRLLVTPEGRTSLYARLAARQPKGGALILTHHMDVVPAGPGWSRDPFAGELHDGRLWGRGAIDTKGLGIAQLGAFLELHRRGVELERDVVFLAVADEETGGSAGMAWLFEHYPELFENVAAVFNEGGSNKVINGRILWWEVEVAQKRPLWLRVRTSGRGGHAASHNPGSAPHQLLRALARVVERPIEYRVSPPVRSYLQALAPHHQGKYGRIFADIDRYVEPDGPTTPLVPGIANLFVNSVQVTVLEGSDSINVVPAEASALIDCRLLPDTDSEAFLEELKTLLGKRVEVEVLVTSPPAAPSPTDDAAYRAIAEVLGGSAPVVPSMISGYTDSRHFRERGIPAYGLIPFALEPEDRRGVHGKDERLPVVELDRGVQRLLDILLAYAAASP